MRKLLRRIDMLLYRLGPDRWRWWRGYGITPRQGAVISFFADDSINDGDAVVDEAPEHDVATNLVILLRNNAKAFVRVARAADAVCDKASPANLKVLRDALSHLGKP
jgi:hypothetical protein